MRSPSTGAVEDSSSAHFHTGRPGGNPQRTSPVGGLQMAQDYAHEPAMVKEVVDLFAPVPEGVVIDATVGGGGHAAALLEAYRHLSLLGLDRDPAAVEATRTRLGVFGPRAAVLQSRFSGLENALSAIRASLGRDQPVVGVLLDLGVSSPQLDRADRGFSYRSTGPLDMRMDPTAGTGAFEVVNSATDAELAALFAWHGEARFARRIAGAIVAARPVTSTTELAEIVSRAVPAATRRRGHPARRVFQALRVAVNEELDELAAVLPQALRLITPGGRCVVIAYHSGEDRLVKAAFNEAVTGGCVCPPGLPCACGARATHRLVFRRARRPTLEEVARNHRAESARLRAVERVVL